MITAAEFPGGCPRAAIPPAALTGRGGWQPGQWVVEGLVHGQTLPVGQVELPQAAGDAVEPAARQEVCWHSRTAMWEKTMGGAWLIRNRHSAAQAWRLLASAPAGVKKRAGRKVEQEQQVVLHCPPLAQIEIGHGQTEDGHEGGKACVTPKQPGSCWILRSKKCVPSAEYWPPWRTGTGRSWRR